MESFASFTMVTASNSHGQSSWRLRPTAIMGTVPAKKRDDSVLYLRSSH